MMLRTAIVSLCMLGGAAYLGGASKAERVPPREPMAGFPLTIDRWSGREAPALAPDVLAVLGADEHVNRIYSSSASSAASSGQIGLYIGYYASQREGDTIHSPLNCLPGAGWQPVSKAYVNIPIPGAGQAGLASIRVNQIVVQKGLDRQLVLYWYQSHGRVVPNEYWSKLFMVYDAVRLNRTDAALVRVVSPISGKDADIDTTAAAGRAEDFVKAMFPLLEGYLPS